MGRARRRLGTMFFSLLFGFTQVLGQREAQAHDINEKENRTVRGVVALVPGFLNSLTKLLPRSTAGVEGKIDEANWAQENLPSTWASSAESQHYFNPDILEAIRGRGFAAYVAPGLKGVGTIQSNGSIVGSWLKSIEARHPRLPLVVVGHSAGALYALWAMTEQKISIHALVSIGTPFSGSGLADLLTATKSRRDRLRQLGLESIIQLSRQGIQNVAKDLVLKNQIPIFSVAGVQDPGEIWQAGWAEFLSPLFTIAARIMGIPSDGVVSLDSALGRGFEVQTALGPAVAVTSWRDVFAPLEHMEQAIDHRVFSKLGVVNALWIRDQQIKLYLAILDRVLPK